jgi:hypothetical protein
VQERIAVLLVGALLALTGCGGGDEEGGGSSTSDIRQEFDTALRENLLNQQDLTEELTDCILAELQRSVTDEQIEAAKTSEEVRADLAAEGAKARLTCEQGQ